MASRLGLRPRGPWSAAERPVPFLRRPFRSRRLGLATGAGRGKAFGSGFVLPIARAAAGLLRAERYQGEAWVEQRASHGVGCQPGRCVRGWW